MARDHARFVVRIWDSTEWKSLKFVQQWAYFALVSSEDISYCGVAPNVPDRFANRADGMTPRLFRTALLDLARLRYVILDDKTGEILVRTYVRHDGLLKQPNMAKAMVKALFRVHSTDLRDAVVCELVRAKQDEPDAKGWAGVESESEDLYAEICLKASLNPFENPSENPSGKGSENA